MKLLLQFVFVFLLVPAICEGDGDGSILRKIGRIENLFEQLKTMMADLSQQLRHAPDCDATTRTTRTTTPSPATTRSPGVGVTTTTTTTTPGTAGSTKDCSDPVYKALGSGVRVIKPDGQTPITVYCDQDTDNGGWTVFQRRKDGSVDFYRTFAEYQDGFGDLEGEFWLGLDDLRLLTSNGRYELRVDMSMWNGTRYVASYSSFNIDDSSDNYRLHLGSFLGGNAGESLSAQNNFMFSAKDKDNDVDPARHCAQSFYGGYWYGGCHFSNLNGLYHQGGTSPLGVGLNWYSLTGYFYSLKTVEMKIRPVTRK